MVGVDEGDETGEGVLKCAEEFVGSRVNSGSLCQNFLRSLGGVDLFGYACELGLVFVQVVKGDLEEAIKGNVDHLVVAEFFCEGVST